MMLKRECPRARQNVEERKISVATVVVVDMHSPLLYKRLSNGEMSSVTVMVTKMPYLRRWRDERFMGFRD